MKKLLLSILLICVVALFGCTTVVKKEKPKESDVKKEEVKKEEKQEKKEEPKGDYVNSVELKKADFVDAKINDVSFKPLETIELNAKDIRLFTETKNSIVAVKSKTEDNFVKDISIVRINKADMKEEVLYKYNGEKKTLIPEIRIGEDRNVYWWQDYEDNSADYMAIRLNEKECEGVDTMHPDFRAISYDPQYFVMQKDMTFENATKEALSNLRSDNNKDIPMFKENKAVLLYQYKDGDGLRPEFSEYGDKFAFYKNSKTDSKNEKYENVDLYIVDLFDKESKPNFIDRNISAHKKSLRVRTFEGEAIYPRMSKDGKFSFITHFGPSSGDKNNDSFVEYKTDLDSSIDCNITKDYIIFTDMSYEGYINNIYIYNKEKDKKYKINMTGAGISYVQTKFPNHLIINSSSNFRAIDLDKMESRTVNNASVVERNGEHQDIYYYILKENDNYDLFRMKVEKPLVPVDSY